MKSQHHGIALLTALGFILSAMPVLAVTVQVQQVALTFSPNDITINEGDTVEWVWNSLAHTVTSGTGSGDQDVGVLFDEILDSLNPTVSFTFNTAGDYPYFCRPHELQNMNGIVRVQVSQPIPTLSEWGLILLIALLLITGVVMMRRRSTGPRPA